MRSRTKNLMDSHVYPNPILWLPFISTANCMCLYIYTVCYYIYLFKCISEFSAYFSNLFHVLQFDTLIPSLGPIQLIPEHLNQERACHFSRELTGWHIYLRRGLDRVVSVRQDHSHLLRSHNTLGRSRGQIPNLLLLLSGSSYDGAAPLEKGLLIDKIFTNRRLGLLPWEQAVGKQNKEYR